MLACERPHNVSPLSPADRDRAATGWVDDFLVVASHVITDHVNYPNTTTMQRLLDALESRCIPDLQTTNTIVGWTIFALERSPMRSGSLTDSQRAVLAAAWRISDSLHGPRYP